MDPELNDLLEEMAISDQANSGDFKAWKDDIKRQTMNKINRLRRADRKVREAREIRSSSGPLVFDPNRFPFTHNPIVPRPFQNA